MTLPYENATSGRNAMVEIQAILRGFGATSFSFSEDFATSDLLVAFQRQGRNVVMRASARGYAAAWLKHHPWSNRMRATKQEHEAKALKVGQVAVYSILRDWVKGQVTAIETGMLTFEGAFLGQILLPNGNTVLQQVEATGALMIEDHSE